MRRTIGGFLMVGLMSAALGQKQAPPPPSPPRPFEFPKAQKKVLGNGLTIFVVEDHRLPWVTYDLAVMAGSFLDGTDKVGLANLAAGLLREGTKTRDSKAISKLVDNAGGGLGASAGDDTISVTAGFMKQYADLGLELLADVALNPTFPQEEIDRQLRQLQSGLTVSYASAGPLAAMASARALLGQHPYAYPNEGTPQTLRQIKREDIVAFHQKYFGPANAMMVIAGDLTPEEAFAKVEKYLGAWKGGPSATQSIRPPMPGKPGVLVIDLPSAVQSEIRIGHASIRRNDPDYIALAIGNQIFGGSFNSRVNMKLRANEGLTYGAGSSLSGQRQAGTFSVSTSTRTEKTADAVQFILDLFKEWKANPTTEAEFKETQQFMVGSFGLSVETAEAVAGRVIGAAVNGLGDDYWPGYRTRLLALKGEDVAAAVGRQIDLAKLQIVCVGKASEIAKPLEKFGPVTVIAAADFDPVAPDLRKPKEAVGMSAEATAAAKKLVERAVTAMGGQKALETVKEISGKSTMAIKSPQGSMNAEATDDVAFPDQFRTSMKFPFGEMIQASDGKAAWMKQGTQMQDLPPQMTAEIKKAVLSTSALGLLREAGAGRAKLGLIAALELDGKKLEGVQMNLDAFEVKLYFDGATGLPARLSQRTVGPMGAIEQDFDYADWREVAGVKLAFAETIYQNGNKAADRKYSERTVNRGIPPETFMKPASAEATAGKPAPPK